MSSRLSLVPVTAAASMFLVFVLLAVRPAASHFAAAVDPGAELYAKHCANCHGAEGAGDGMLGSALKPPPTDLTDAETMAALTDEALLKAMAEGKGMMPGLGSAVSEEELKALLAYVRTLGDAGDDE
jgi:mono/diheme cytochrome c family protein